MVRFKQDTRSDEYEKLKDSRQKLKAENRALKKQIQILRKQLDKNSYSEDYLTEDEQIITMEESEKSSIDNNSPKCTECKSLETEIVLVGAIKFLSCKNCKTFKKMKHKSP